MKPNAKEVRKWMFDNVENFKNLPLWLQNMYVTQALGFYQETMATT